MQCIATLGPFWIRASRRFRRGNARMDQDDNQTNRMAGADFLTSLVLIAAGICVFTMSRQMKVFRTLTISPGLFPMILGGVFVFFGIVMCIMSLRRGGLARARRILSPEYLSVVWHSPRFLKGLVVLGLILAYVLLFGSETLAALNFHFTVGNGTIIPVNIGFLATTAGYLFLTFIYLKAMRPLPSLIVAVVAALIVFYIFNKGFGIPIP